MCLQADPYAAGAFRGTATFGSPNKTLTALYSYDDVFVMKLAASGTVQHAMRSGGNGGDRAARLTLARNAGDGGQVRVCSQPSWAKVQ